MLVVAGLDSFDSAAIGQRPTPNIDQIIKDGEGGRMHTPENLDRSELITQVLWPSMFAGKNPKDLFPSYYKNVGQSTKRWNTPILDNELVHFIEKRISTSLSLDKKQKIKEILGELGAEKEDLGEKKLAKDETLISRADAPHIISVPGINEDSVNQDLKNMIAPETSKSSPDFSGYEPSCNISEFEQKAITADADRLMRLLNAVESRTYDLVICHFFSIDLIQHVWADNSSKLDRWYGLYDDFVGQIQRELSQGDTLVLISDHGMEKNGIHSKRAFYASTDPIWRDDHRKMEDLKTVLEAELANHSHSDQSQTDSGTAISEDTKDHLAELGYF